MNKLFLISGIIAASFTAFSSAAFAEGSNDLVNNTGNNGYRPYLEWRDRQNFGLQRKSVIYVYAEEGETIYFGSSVWRSSEKALKSVLSDNPEEITENIGHDMTGATVAITLPAKEGGMPYDPTDAEVEIDDDGVIGNFKWRSVLDGGNITAGNTGIYLTRPDGTYKGYIQNTSQEEIGPHIEGIDGTDGGYEPMSFTAPVTGTYAFRFLSSDYGEGDPEHIKVDETWLTGKLPDGTDNYLETTKENDATVAAWDITVVDNGEKQEGRVWTDTLFLNTGAHETPLKSEIYTLTYDGFEYRVNLNGMEPFGFALYSNNRGPLLDLYNMAQPNGSRPWGENGEVERSFDYLRSLTHSFYSYTENNDVGPGPTRTEKDGNGNTLYDSKGYPVKSTIINNFDPVDPKRDHTHKLFFNRPSTEAVSAYTRQKKLVEEIDDIIPPKDEPTVTYDGYGYAAGSEGDTSYGTWGIGGAFKIDLGADANFESNTTDTYRIVLDFSEYALDENNKPIIRNGLWAKRAGLTGDENTVQQENEKNNIVILVKVLEKNQEEILWDGQDAYGNNVPVGIYEGVGNTSWETGAAHFPLVDVEYNPHGIIIERMNRIADDEADTEEARYTVYYNNEANGNDNTAWYYAGVTDGNYPTIGDGKNMLAGTSSEKGAMQYKGDITNEGNGNYTVLDIWSRYIAPSKSGITIGVKRLPSQSSATVSFVAAEGVTNDSTFKKSHVKQNGKTLWETENRGDADEEDIYGNTISTGFTATVTKGEIDNYGYDYITWDITIPMEGETYTYYDTSSGQAKPVTATAEPSYIKIPSENGGVNAQNEEIIMSIAEMFGEGALDQEVSTGSEGEIEDLGSDPSYAEEEFDSGLTAVSLMDAEGNEKDYNNGVWDVELKLDGTPVLEDGNSKVNKGDIYKITGIGAGGTVEYKKLQLQLAYKLPVKVSGGATVTYGIIIDNLYAPSAVAEINYSQEVPSAEYDDLDSNGNAVQAGRLDEYDNKSDYNKSDYNN
ncbi:MAG: hypothetical protein ACLRQ0_01840 [Monoglobales bacterium]